LPRPNTALTGIAGVHHVVSELSRRGLVALPTIRNTAAYDVIVATPDGTRHANIQVKASQKRRLFFPMPESEKVRAGPHDYYVLLRWLAKEEEQNGFRAAGFAKVNARAISPQSLLVAGTWSEWAGTWSDARTNGAIPG